MKIVGAFKVDRIVESTIEELWKIVGNKAGVTREEFNVYFEGVSVGVGIFLNESQRFPEPINLQDLKDMIDFTPPQGFRYVTEEELISLQFVE